MIAFFDLDKTLLSVNSGSLWIRSEFREHRIGLRTLAVATSWIGLYHLGLAGHMERALRAGVGSLAGQLESEIRARTLEFYEREVKRRVRPGASAALEAHRARGDRLVLLTTSSNYLSEPIARQLGLDDFISNRFEVDALGRFTGQPIEPLCFGEGKRTLAERYARTLNVSLEACSFYTDSASDIPVMEAVGEPVAVHPDRLLRKEALRRGWRVVDWGS